MDDDKYDEFGNYIGKELLSDEDSDEAYGINDVEMGSGDSIPSVVKINKRTSDIVLHEDKKYYPSAEEIYGSDVETLVEEEDAQPLTEPIIKPVDNKTFAYEHGNDGDDYEPHTVYDTQFLRDLTTIPDSTRNVALVGNLHSGKTTLLDCLIGRTHPELLKFGVDSTLRYTDTLFIEKE
ncbi:116 kDa U5 small nuclear ribonucleoprotein component-like, partial [Pempheris klunzingeri]|uniref:116 kDa U5 small nuclear ribonucleoprotein component-like n=1 Tax=Pempheris klunzingeri TaxID=3127111 RepID=UPI0039811621